MRTGIYIVLVFLIFPLTGFASGWEYYVEPKVIVSLNKSNGFCLNLKEETRFKNGKNYYDKTFVGLSKKLKKDIEFSLYGAVVEIKKKDRWDVSYLLWPELACKHRLSKYELNSNSKLECFIIENRWNFREQLSIAFPINDKISFWLGDEPRLLSLFDKTYFGENEALAGISCNLIIKTISSSLNIFYDLRSIKQNGNWENTNCIRNVLNFTF